MYSIKTIIISLLLIASLYGKAQITGIEVETDPSYFVYKGYSVDIAVATQRMLFRALPFQTDVPSVFQGGNKNFKQTLRGFAIDVDYFFLKKETKGFFAGVTFSYSKDAITNQINNQQISNNHSNAGFRFGYRWFPFYKKRHKQIGGREDGFFITPFIAPLFNFGDNLNFADGRVYKYSPFLPFGGVHVGWKFNFKKSKN